MVTFAAQDRKSPVELFEEDETDELMWKCHGRQGKYDADFLPQFLFYAECAADDKSKCTGALRLLL